MAFVVDDSSLAQLVEFYGCRFACQADKAGDDLVSQLNLDTVVPSGDFAAVAFRQVMEGIEYFLPRFVLLEGQDAQERAREVGHIVVKQRFFGCRGAVDVLEQRFFGCDVELTVGGRFVVEDGAR